MVSAVLEYARRKLKNYSQSTRIVSQACQPFALRLCNSSWLEMCLDISTTCQEPLTHNSTLSIHTVHLTYCTCPSLHLLYIYIGVHPRGVRGVAQSCVCAHKNTKRRFKSTEVHGNIKVTGRQEKVGQASKL